MAEAVVQFDYAAQESDELTLKIGDVITDIVISPGGWWEGNLKGTRGMFPDNFVKLVGAEDDNNSTVTHRTNPGRKCKVLFSYDPSNDDELKLQVNDIIDIIGEVEEGWWKGELRDQTGVFPSNFVSELTEDQIQELDAHSQRQPRKLTEFEVAKVAENKVNHSEEVVQLPAARATVSTDSELPTLPPKPVKETCRVLFPYQASVDDELTLQEGDIIVIISKDGQDKGWWKGELNGKIGVFPDNFVQVLPAVEENSKPVRPPSKASIVTTNRTRDSITKTPLISNTTSPPTLPNAQKKTLDTPPKPDEKTSPPGISKKPNLPPPPLKKPQRSPSGSTKQTAPSPTLSDSFIKPESPSTGSVKSPAISPASKSGLSQETTPLYPKLSPGLRKAETSDSTDGAILSAFSTSSGSYSLNHHNDSNSYNNEVEKSEMDLDCVGRTAMLTHPTASRVRAPRRRLPSNMSSKDEGPENVRNSVAMMNGNIDNHVDNKGQIPSKSFLEELKLKQFSQGRTRVMIGPGSGGGESAVSPEPPSASSTPLKLPGSGVTFRNNTSPFNQRPQSMFGGEKTSPNTRPFSVIGTASASSENITLSVKQWNEINDKVSRLETMLESQNFMFTKAIKELTSKLNEETERRLKMQLELEKLTNLVTQV